MVITRYWSFLCVVVFVAFCNGQSENDIDSEIIQKAIESEFPDLNVNVSALPMKEVEAAIREKCTTNGGPFAFHTLKEKMEAFRSRFEEIFDFEKIKAELDEKMKTGSMEDVFKKYCDQLPDLQGYIDEFRDALLICLQEEEQPTVSKAFNISHDIADFSCYRDGDRLAMFVSEGGIECVTSKKEELQSCIKDSIMANLPENVTQMMEEGTFSSIQLPLLIINQNSSEEFDTVQYCISSVLQTCPESTPANVVDALFKYVRKLVFEPHTPIRYLPRAKGYGYSPSGGATVTGSLLFVLGLLFIRSSSCVLSC